MKLRGKRKVDRSGSAVRFEREIVARRAFLPLIFSEERDRRQEACILVQPLVINADRVEANLLVLPTLAFRRAVWKPIA